MNLAAANKRKPSINQHRHTQFRFGLHGRILAWLGVLIVWLPALFTYFSQDDFTHLLISRVDHWYEIWKFLIPVQTGIFYRPLSIQFSTWLLQSTFGLRPFWFHLVALLIHAMNVWLVYKLLFQFIKRETLAWLGALLYGFHPVHFMSIFWLAEFSMVLAPFFAFTAIMAFIHKRYKWFLALMLGGLLSNELVVTVPAILATYTVTTREWKRLFWLMPAFLMAIGLLMIRFVLVPTSLGSEYVLSFSPLVWLGNLRWQFLRSIGLPEGFRAYMSGPSVQLALGSLLGFWVVWLSCVRLKRTVWWGLVWYVFSLMPVLWLSHHQSPIYQIIGLPGFILAILMLGEQIVESKLRVSLLATLFFVSAFWSVRAMNDYHWVTKRARIARYHIEKLQLHNPQPNSPIIFLNTSPTSSQQVYMALAGDHGVKVFFGGDAGVSFEDFDPGGYPPNAIFLLSRTENQMK